MIKDKLENAANYYSISYSIQEGFEWLKAQDLEKIEDGKYIINEENYANVQTYTTKDNALYEAHREYIDIQYMVNGVEKIGVTDYKNCSSNIKYDKNKDIEFLNNNQEETFETIEQGEFLVLFPNDAHKPSIKIDTNKTVKKVVVKVKI